MLIDEIKNYAVVMPELIDFLKQRGYNPVYFFTKMDLSLQYIIIFEFLLRKHDIVMIVTPNVIGVRAYRIGVNYNDDVIFVEPTPADYKVNNNCYIKLICKAFEYIENTVF